jgi:hypothetical protein
MEPVTTVRYSTVRYSVRLNNVPLELFKSSCGLHQGDMISPCLFLFIADGLSRLLQWEVEQGNLHQLRMYRRAPGVSHLLFANDTLMFMKVKDQQALVIDRALHQYEQGTGQLINPAKCSIMFGKNCEEDDKKKVKEILNAPQTTKEEKYLGLHTPHGWVSKEHFKSTKERLAKHFTSWAKRFMSSGAKEVLINSVAQAIPTYVMGGFKLSGNLCEEMTQIIHYFW